MPKEIIFSITAWCYLGRENFPLPSCAGCTGSNCIGCCRYQQEAYFQFQKTSLTLLTELICLSSCIFIWQCRIKVSCIFFCVCFTTCIFLRGYWTKQTCAIRLHLHSNWSDFSDWGISQIGIKHISPTEKTQQKLKRYLLQASWLQSRCNFYFLFFCVWLYEFMCLRNINQCRNSSFAASLFIVHTPIFITFVALWCIYVLGLNKLRCFRLDKLWCRE